MVEICFHEGTGKAEDRRNKTPSSSLSKYQLAIQPISMTDKAVTWGLPSDLDSIHIPKKHISSSKIQPKTELNSLDKQNVENEKQLWCFFCVPMTNANHV